MGSSNRSSSSILGELLNILAWANQTTAGQCVSCVLTNDQAKTTMMYITYACGKEPLLVKGSSIFFVKAPFCKLLNRRAKGCHHFKWHYSLILVTIVALFRLPVWLRLLSFLVALGCHDNQIMRHQR
jgi:hypothetical protein